MNIENFDWFPDAGSQHTVKPAVATSKFGDGYEQRMPLGINTLPMTWSLTFTRPRWIGKQILAFLRARAGVEAFFWTNPLEEAGTYICRTWKLRSSTPEVMEITCDFEQTFDAITY